MRKPVYYPICHLLWEKLVRQRVILSIFHSTKMWAFSSVIRWLWPTPHFEGVSYVRPHPLSNPETFNILLRCVSSCFPIFSSVSDATLSTTVSFVQLSSSWLGHQCQSPAMWMSLITARHWALLFAVSKQISSQFSFHFCLVMLRGLRCSPRSFATAFLHDCLFPLRGRLHEGPFWNSKVALENLFSDIGNTCPASWAVYSGWQFLLISQVCRRHEYRSSAACNFD